PRTASVSRAKFASVVERLVGRLRGPVGKALRDGSADPAEVDDVILVGGATRMEVVRSFVREWFNKEPLSSFDPDEVVALGAAVQAALIADDRSVDDMVLTDVCPYTLGVDYTKQFGGRYVDGYFKPIIHRNTTIPVSKEDVFVTMHANTREVEFGIYQGEGRKAQDNLKLGQLKVTGIPPGPAGMAVHVRFTYDINGILEVEAYVPDSGKKFRTVLTQHAKSLAKSQIDQAIKNLQKLKFYPRDDIRNRRLVLFCERMVGEVAPFLRNELEEAIDVFENAMASGDREYFKFAREGLLTTLSRLGLTWDEDLAETGDDASGTGKEAEPS
ncbi:MAG: Hsp70 family protein, partial [Planctomycetes bacterium]|nr:Hsp70 family protein [Planctomycetota bacterium]